MPALVLLFVYIMFSFFFIYALLEAVIEKC